METPDKTFFTIIDWPQGLVCPPFRRVPPRAAYGGRRGGGILCPPPESTKIDALKRRYKISGPTKPAEIRGLVRNKSQLKAGRKIHKNRSYKKGGGGKNPPPRNNGCPTDAIPMKISAIINWPRAFQAPRFSGSSGSEDPILLPRGRKFRFPPSSQKIDAT